jgi:LPPG:FO 2-phospho-L-lactate transferase
VLCGGVGAAKLLAGMVRVLEGDALTAIVNVGDDFELHGLEISPDLDTVVYTVAGAIDPERGWGLRDETWHAMEALSRYDTETWFNLGDRDLATHMYRTERRRAGAPLSQVSAQIARAWGLGLRVLPASDDRLRTIVTLAESGEQVSFQDYFVRQRHDVAVTRVDFDGAADAAPAPGVLDAIAGADVVVVAPSNPLISIGPVLAVPGVRAAVQARRDQVVAVSPIVAGQALKGPADRLLGELGHERSVLGVARLYAEIAETLVIDEADAGYAEEIGRLGLRCVVTDTIMRDPDRAARLSQAVLAAMP